MFEDLETKFAWEGEKATLGLEGVLLLHVVEEDVVCLPCCWEGWWAWSEFLVGVGEEGWGDPGRPVGAVVLGVFDVGGGDAVGF